MKKIMLRLYAIACIGLALTACGGHKENDGDANKPEPQAVIDTMGANHPEEKDEHKQTKDAAPKKEDNK